jgi:hypothetical protein
MEARWLLIQVSRAREERDEALGLLRELGETLGAFRLADVFGDMRRLLEAAKRHE